MKKRLIVLTLLFTCVLAMVGCGQTETKTVVTFWHTMGKENQEILNNIITQFELENPDIKVEHVQKGDYDDLRDSITKAFRAGEEPSLTFSYPDHVAVYRNGGHVVDLLTYINDPVYGYTQEELNAFVPEYYTEGLVEEDGETFLYSLPYAKSTEVMFYNKTFFDENNLTVPTTWDEVVTVSQKIRTIVDKKIEKEVNEDPTIKDADKKETIATRQADVTPFGYDSESNLFITMAEQLQNEYTSSKGEYLFNNKGNKEFVTKLKDWYDQKLFTSKEMLQGSYTSTKFTTEKLYMSVGSTGGTRYNIPDADGSTGELSFEVGVAAVPQWNLSSPKVIQQGPNITILKSDEKTQLASWKFLKYLLEPTNNATYAIATGYSPVTTTAQQVQAYQNLLVDDNEELFTASDVHRLVKLQTLAYEESHSYFVSPAFDGSSQARTQVGSLISSVFAGTKTVEQAFDDALNNCKY